MSSQQRREDALRLAQELAAAERDLLAQQIIAPSVPRARLRVRHESLLGLIYEFGVEPPPFTGWGCFQPTSTSTARLVREALPWEREGYLEQLPRLRSVLLWPDESRWLTGDVWWALPYNAGDAARRFPFLGDEPFAVFLCNTEDGADRFARVVVRVDGGAGGARWYGGPDARADPRHAELLRAARASDAQGGLEHTKRFSGLAASERRALTLDRLHALDLLRREERLASARLEEELRYALAKAGARLLSWRELPGENSGQPGSLVVEWSSAGGDEEGAGGVPRSRRTHRYTSTVARNLSVVSSGICLSGQDRTFDLTSLVGVMEHRPGWQSIAAGDRDDEDEEEWE